MEREEARRGEAEGEMIPVEELRPGQYVGHVRLGGLDGALVPVGRAMLNTREIEDLRRSGAAFAFVDREKSVDLRLKGATGREAPELAELREARAMYADAVACARSVMEDARLGLGVDVARVEPVVEGVIRSVARDRSALFSILKLKAYDEYSFTHGVNVCVMAVVFGRMLGYEGEALKDLGMAAFLHDVGKAAIPPHVLGKPGPLTEEEFRIAKLHTAAGFKMLMESEAVSVEVARVALEHHERLRGDGYPRSLSGEEIAPMARIVGLCDVYDAMTSDRSYRRAMPPADALARMYAGKGKSFEAEYVERFIKCVGVYPEGSFVRLDDGRVGMVARNDPERLLQPQVRIFIDASGDVRRPQLVDLAERRGALRVTGPFDPRPLGLDLSEALGLAG